MDITNTILGIVFFLLIIIPIFVINTKSRIKKNQLLNTLNDLSVDKTTKFSETDFCNNDSGIGLKENILVFFRKEKNETKHDVVDLKEVKKCSLFQFDKHGNTPKNTEN